MQRVYVLLTELGMKMSSRNSLIDFYTAAGYCVLDRFR